MNVIPPSCQALHRRRVVGLPRNPATRHRGTSLAQALRRGTDADVAGRCL